MNNNSTEMGKRQFSMDESDVGSSDAITVMSVFLSVLKRPWILIVSFLVVLAPLMFYLMNVSTIYKSSATVMVSVRGSSIMDAVSVVEGTSSNSKSEKYYTSILDSRAFRDDVADVIVSKLPDLPTDSLRSVVRRSIGYEVNRREPGFIDIYATSQSTSFALLLAETALDRFKYRSINLEREDVIHISEFINSQVESISSSLGKAEEELQVFLSKKNLVLVDVDAGITQELFILEQKHNESKANLEMIKINIASYDLQLNNLLNELAENSTNVSDQRISVIKDRLAEIRETLTYQSSLKLSESEIKSLDDSREQLRAELLSLVVPTSKEDDGSSFNVGVTIQRLEKELEQSLLHQTEYQNQVTFYGLQIKRFRDEHPNLSEDILTYASLSRAKTVLQKTLDILLEKREEVRIRIESEMGGIKTIDAPLKPDIPLARKRLQKLLLGIIAALGLGIGISVIVDRFDDTIKDESDIQNMLGLAVFGTIPSLDDEKFGKWKYDRYSQLKDERVEDFKKGDNPDNKVNKKLLKYYSEKAPIAEAYRSLKINLQFLANDTHKKVFVISSPSASEGKSLTSANLGISFARGGSKTIIVDCDLRKSSQHKNLETDRKPGLTNYLYGENTLEEVIRNVDIENLSLISAGSSPTNPAGLLASEKMHELIETLRGMYDFVLVDSPPVLVCSDSRILAEFVDGMIMIAKVESTDAKALKHAVALTHHLDIEISGVILNQVDFKFGRAYYYTYRYYKPYSYYSGYYYKRAYYDYTESEAGERTKVPGTGKTIRKKRTEKKA